MRIGLIVNPIAGLGGRVGLKGTDGPGTVAAALARGAEPDAGPRTRRALARLAERLPGAHLFAAPGRLGAEWIEGLNLAVTLRDPDTDTQTARDTRLAVEAMADLDLILFAGGDGTARDVCAAIATSQPILGIPCGVKMHSGVFAVSPEAAGALLADILDAPDRITWTNDAEVMDIDEAALREGHIAPELYGHARVPIARGRMQASKGGPRRNWSALLEGAAAELVAEMDPETLYVIGPGTSAGAVMHAAGHTPTVLGIDAMLGGNLLAGDIGAAELERLAGDRPIRVVLGVTGQQGFLIGRGNQQISPKVLAKAGREGLIVLAAEDKLLGLAQPRLWVDSGDPGLDAKLEGFVRVRTAPGRATMMRLSAG
ncbi:MAG: ATP-NAD kinase family protein [Roseibium sp.]|nr:ATP-NAD kinase family protein [Roseibium sp.]